MRCTKKILYKIRTITVNWTDQLIYHLRRIICQVKFENSNEPNFSKNKRLNDKRKIAKAKKRNNVEKMKEHFTNLVNNYQNIEYTQEKLKQNGWDDYGMNKSNWHTKFRCLKQGLHLIIHHLGDKKSKQAFRNGFTILIDPRLINRKQEHWPLRLELESIYGKLRKMRTYIMIKNEFDKAEIYPKFYKRMKESGLTLKNQKRY